MCTLSVAPCAIGVVVMLSLMSQHVIADRYLIVFGPESDGSHMITMTSVAGAMSERNHNVTLLMAKGLDQSIKRAMGDKHYSMEFYEPSLQPDSGILTKWSALGLNGSYFEMFKFASTVFPKLFKAFCEDIFNDVALLQRLQERHFDLVFVHTIFACPVLLAQKLDIRFVTITPAIPPSAHLRMYCNPVNPAYNPELFTGFSDRMSFTQRLKNTFYSIFQWLLSDISYRTYDEVKQKYNIKPSISTSQTLAQSEIWFINSHFVLDFPRPYQPNVVSVGGLTAKPAKQLPQDLESFMLTSGSEGVIIFSLGTYVNAMDTTMSNVFAEAFANLPHKVLWKSAGKPPSTLSSNVKMLDWLPQNDILGHPQTRLMIYHCGINGVFEAIYHGIPVICIPIQSDQWDNAKRLEVKEVGLQLELATLTSHVLIEAVNTVTGNKSYQSKMERMSNIVRDEHLHPAHRVVYWMEKVIRHGGAAHLKTSAFELNAIQHNLLDVIAFLAIVSIALGVFVTHVFVLFCRCLSKCCCEKRIKEQKQD